MVDNTNTMEQISSVQVKFNQNEEKKKKKRRKYHHEKEEKKPIEQMDIDPIPPITFNPPNPNQSTGGGGGTIRLKIKLGKIFSSFR